jgi:ribosomal protein L21
MVISASSCRGNRNEMKVQKVKYKRKKKKRKKAGWDRGG